MNPFLSVRARLFGLCVGLLAVMGAANLLLAQIIGAREPQEFEQREQYERVQTIQAVYQAVNDHRTWQGQVNTSVLLGNEVLRRQAEERFATVTRELESLMAEMHRFDPQGVDIVRGEMNALPLEMQDAIAALAGGKKEEANALYRTVWRRIDAIQDTLKAAIEREQKQADAVQQLEK